VIDLFDVGTRRSLRREYKHELRISRDLEMGYASLFEVNVNISHQSPQSKKHNKTHNRRDFVRDSNRVAITNTVLAQPTCPVIVTAKERDIPIKGEKK
jgi:hypothetical protein